MLASRADTGSKPRRILCLAVLLFLFGLPLHAHVPFGDQNENECSCIHGKFTDVIPPSAMAGAGPAPAATGFASPPAVSWTEDRFSPRNVRAPPLLLSI